MKRYGACPHLFLPFLGLPAPGDEGGQYSEFALLALDPPREIGGPLVPPAIAATPATSSAAASTGLRSRDLRVLRARNPRTDDVARLMASSFIRSSSRGVGSARSRRRRSSISCRSAGSRSSSWCGISTGYTNEGRDS